MISRESSESPSKVLCGELGDSEGCGTIEEMGDGGWIGSSGGRFCCKLVTVGCDMATRAVVLGHTSNGGVDIASRNVGGG